MKKPIIHTVLALVAAAALSGCNSIHELPDGNAVDPTSVKVGLSLNMDFSFDNDTDANRPASDENSEYDIRYIVDVFALSGPDKGKCTQRIILNDCSPENNSHNYKTSLNLHAGLYEFRVWVDFVNKGTCEDLYYEAGDLRQVCISMPYQGCVNAKDAFCGTQEVDLTAYRNDYFAEHEVKMKLERPFGKFKIVATDLDKFVSSIRDAASDGPVSAKISYSGYFPCGYDVTRRAARAEYFETGVHFTGAVTGYSDTQAILASDYVFICEENSTVANAEMTVYDGKGRVISRVSNLRIPIRRGAVTEVSGEFLTKTVGGGGVGIDGSFDGDIDIVLPD